MNRRIRRALFGAIALVVLVLAGCSGASETSIGARIDSFESAINNNRSAAWENFHPDSSAYTQRRDADTWSTDFPESETYTITITNTGSDSASGTISSSQDFYEDDSITFQMRNDPEDGGGLFGGGEVDNWKILSISGAVTVN
ncbi:MAG: hypothetical protein ACOCWS_04605 [Alkalispirochaetaceae bacterium]